MELMKTCRAGSHRNCLRSPRMLPGSRTIGVSKYIIRYLL